MSTPHDENEETTKTGAAMETVFHGVEMAAYLILGTLLALTTLLAVVNAGASLWASVATSGASDVVVATIDRLLFVFMLVEILHTVRVSFRTGILTAEPFLIVGLIASIRRVLVITLKSSAALQGSKVVGQATPQFDETMLELGVLGGLILIMVFSIYLVRRSEQTSK